MTSIILVVRSLGSCYNNLLSRCTCHVARVSFSEQLHFFTRFLLHTRFHVLDVNTNCEVKVRSSHVFRIVCVCAIWITGTVCTSKDGDNYVAYHAYVV